MRRKDRELTLHEAQAIIDSTLYVVLSTINANGTPYCVPVSFVRKDNTLYFHGATEGQKIENLRVNNNVCVSFVSNSIIPTDKFTVAYESAIVTGIAHEIKNDADKINALRLLCERLTPSNMDNFDKAIEASIKRVGVWKIDIETITGKANRQN